MSDKTHQPNSKNSQNHQNKKNKHSITDLVIFNHRFGNIQTEHLTERERERDPFLDRVFRFPIRFARREGERSGWTRGLGLHSGSSLISLSLYLNGRGLIWAGIDCRSPPFTHPIDREAVRRLGFVDQIGEMEQDIGYFYLVTSE